MGPGAPVRRPGAGAFTVREDVRPIPAKNPETGRRPAP
ncbi:hypothetical protein STVIR_5899 [Streptomyces viridochromogenes Tue57]|uniref:Uncharacterized protein n=1 Tax=Streptomyces viridochromogenes Tue57 TaxID=1160705 RepID=L8PAG5_STRVR|nr:hypothetical protein STVIR_5899 [Streptomyces viridochromogenes Tue57]